MRALHPDSKFGAPPHLLVAGVVFVFAMLSLASQAVAQKDKDACCNVDLQTDEQSITLLNLNAAHGRGKALNQLLVSRNKHYQNLDAVADLLERIDPDLIALQEADAPSRWSGGFDHVRYLMEDTAYLNYIHGIHADTWLYKFGTALLSKRELIDAQAFNFNPTPPTTTKGFVTAKVAWPGIGHEDTVTVISMHLDFSRKRIRKAQTDEIAAFADSLSGPLIISGDFNGEWQDEESAMRLMADSLKLKAYDPFAVDQGTYKSTAGKRLDWILISQDLEFVSYEVIPDKISDHLAVVARIRKKE